MTWSPPPIAIHANGISGSPAAGYPRFERPHRLRAPAHIREIVLEGNRLVRIPESGIITVHDIELALGDIGNGGESPAIPPVYGLPRHLDRSGDLRILLKIGFTEISDTRVVFEPQQPRPAGETEAENTRPFRVVASTEATMITAQTREACREKYAELGELSAKLAARYHAEADPATKQALAQSIASVEQAAALLRPFLAEPGQMSGLDKYAVAFAQQIDRRNRRELLRENAIDGGFLS